MSTASPAAVATASNSDATPRKWTQFVLQRLAKAPLQGLAEALDKDDSQVCRIRSGEQRVTFSEALRLIEALGCKVVDIDARCVNRERYEALATIAQAAMACPDTARRLMFEDSF